MSSRPKIPRHQRERIFQRSDGICQRCACQIDIDTFHVSHLRAHINGGALVDENLEAWCSPCNLIQGSKDVCDTRWTPRDWQLEALDRIVKRIVNDQVATVSAAPGAGKTAFAGFVFDALRDMDVVDRMLVLVPRRTLAEQWAEALRNSRHLELKCNAEVERKGQDGVVVLYQSLNDSSVGIHQMMSD